ncbi:MAG: energy-coupling factor transporter transmembrane protein EcfT [Clostridia bacterium]|nr:energy-coupling factor transporter transmembrane protein EcfT [Clostridia bacterium]
MLKDITFGQYVESNSFIHRLDPRTKILLTILGIVFLFLADSNNLFSLLVCIVQVAIIIAFSRVPLRMYLKNIKAILPIIVLTTIINLFYGSGEVLLSFWRVTITTGGVNRAVYMAVRVILLILLSSVLTYTTTPNDITDAIESLLSFLRIFGLRTAVHMLAMMMTIALRFIPTLVEETEKIINAQKARGADLESGKLFQRIRALIPILIPLLISSVRRAYELAEAMECRCYNGGVGRVRMKELKYGLRDITAAAVMLIFCGGVIAVNILL